MTRQTIAPRALRRITRAWADVEYAQRRLFEIQTGIPMTTVHRETVSHRESAS